MLLRIGLPGQPTGQLSDGHYNQVGANHRSDRAISFDLADAIDSMHKTVPPSLTALGRDALPPEIDVGGHRYSLRRIFKNDFFAITSLYEGEPGKVILKIHRRAPLFFCSLRWLGRLLAVREVAAFERLHDVDGIPSVLSRYGPTGIVREYIEGAPLARGQHVKDDFHARLRSLIDTIHDRGMAYVDLEKCENVLVGDDGQPYLFDFQISWYLPARWGGELWPARWLRGWFQKGDLYHLGKLHRRTRPDQLTTQQRINTYRRPWHIHVYRFFTWPLSLCRRVVLSRLDPRRTDGERGRVVISHQSSVASCQSSVGSRQSAAVSDQFSVTDN